jgi:hypothetical protein
MNTVQNTQEKRTIKVRDFLEDFRSGMNDEGLQEKYHLTLVGLERFYSMLLDRGILSPQELQDTYRRPASSKSATEPAPDSSSFICPRCLASHETMFDICPNCGVSFQELIDQEQPVTAQGADKAAAREKADEDSAVPQSVLDEIFLTPRKKESVQPASPVSEEVFASGSQMDKGDDFLQNDDFAKFQSGYEEPTDEVVSGMPLQYADSPDRGFGVPEVCCDSCRNPMEPALRDIYDRQRAYTALIAAGICFVLGLVGSAAVTLFGSFSWIRLLVVCGTGMSFLFGTALLSVGAFLYLARENVYYCPACKRVYPRA